MSATIKVGTQRLDGSGGRTPSSGRWARQQGGRERDREQVDREGPDEVHQPREDRSRLGRRRSRRQAPRARPRQRTPPSRYRSRARPARRRAARHHVAALVVGAQEVVRRARWARSGSRPAPACRPPAGGRSTSCRRRVVPVRLEANGSVCATYWRRGAPRSSPHDERTDPGAAIATGCAAAGGPRAPTGSARDLARRAAAGSRR